jgi:predicted metal-binding membrane protein
MAAERPMLPTPLARERALILTLVLGLSIAAWALLVWQAGAMRSGAMGLTMGMSGALFLAIWVVMMVATMFPAAASMILMFDRIAASKRQRAQAFVPTWVFIGGYLLIWTLFGALAYVFASVADRVAGQSMWLMANASRIGGAVLIAAGLYQLSPLKSVCLSRCRTPTQFIMTSWRDGYGGALRMGIEHGLFCVGCCWLLFLIVFPLGMMNIVALGLLTTLIFAEKALPVGVLASRLAAAALIVYGIVVLVAPAALPTAMS